METVNKVSGCQGWGEVAMSKNTEDLYGSENILHDTTTVCVCIITHLSKCIECTTPKVNPKVNYGLWVIMLCHCRLINCNK